MFEFSQEYEFEAVGDDRPNVVIPNPAPRCKLAIRRDTKAWSVATGEFFKRVSTEDGSTFRDGDGGIWRLVAIDSRDERLAAKDAEIEKLKAALERIASSEAMTLPFYRKDNSEGKELLARMEFAASALKGDAA